MLLYLLPLLQTVNHDDDDKTTSSSTQNSSQLATYITTPAYIRQITMQVRSNQPRKKQLRRTNEMIERLNNAGSNDNITGYCDK